MLSIDIRMSKALYDLICKDLARPHEHACERVGFVFGRISERYGRDPIIYLMHYQPVADERYIQSNDFGALIDDAVILETMQEIRRQRGTGYGAFHVHIHEHVGQPSFSRPDIKSLPAMIPSFQRMDTKGADGLLLLSENHGIAMVWLSDQDAVFASTISVIGAPIKIFNFRGES